MNISTVRRPDWLSTFVVIDAFIVSGLVLTDWLLGKAGRIKLRNRLADFWVALNQMSFRGITERQIKLVNALFDSFFGPRFNAVGYWVGATFWNTLLAGCAYLWLLRQNVPGTPQQQDILIRDWWAAPGVLRTLFAVGITGVLLIGNTVMTVTHWSVRVLMNRISRARVAGAIGIMVALLTFLIAAALTFDAHRFAFPHGVGGTAVLAGSAVLLTSLLWPMILGLLVVIAILSRAIVPQFKRPVILVVERLAESEQGVLTTLSVVLGTMAALLERYFSN